MFGPPKPPIKRKKPWEVPKPPTICDLDVCAIKPVRQTKREKAAIEAAIRLETQKEDSWQLYQSRCRDHLDRKQLLTNLHEEVKHTLNAYENDLKIKREKLRVLLLMEQEAWYKETILQAQQDSEKRFDFMREDLKKLKEHEVVKLEELRKRKKLQLFLNICEELRPEASHTLLLESKRSQLQQIEDKKLIDYVNEKKEEVWAEMFRRDREAALKQQEVERIAKINRNKCTVKFLDEQVKANRLKRLHVCKQRTLDRANMDRIVEENELKDLQEKQAIIDNRLKVKQDLEEQMAENKEYSDYRQKNLDDIAIIYNAHVTNILEQEKKQTIEDKIQTKKETFIFLDDLKNYQRYNATMECVRDQLTTDIKKEIDDKKAAVKAKMTNWAANLQKETFDERKIQMKEKLDRVAKEKEDELRAFKVDEAVREQQDKLEEHYQNQLLQERIEHGEFIKEQFKQKKLQKIRDKCDERAQEASLLKAQQNAYKNCLAHMSLLEKGSMSTHIYRKYIDNACECLGKQYKEKSLRLNKIDQEIYDTQWKQKNYTFPDYLEMEKKLED